MNPMIPASIIRRAGVFTATAIVAVAPLAIPPAGASASACVALTGVQPPNPGGPSNENMLGGVAVVPSCNAWAVGSYFNRRKTLIEHWNGTAWRRGAAPKRAGPSHGDALAGVAAASATNIWAVGGYFNGT